MGVAALHESVPLFELPALPITTLQRLKRVSLLIDQGGASTFAVAGAMKEDQAVAVVRLFTGAPGVTIVLDGDRRNGTLTMADGTVHAVDAAPPGGGTRRNLLTAREERNILFAEASLELTDMYEVG